MRRVKYTNWWDSRKAEQSVESALAKMDLFNKTKYGRKKVTNETLLLEAAKHAHDNELVYYSTILENEKPYCYLEINKGFYRVCFLDEYLRKYMSYDFTDNFKEVNADKLFLSLITFWEFEGSTDKMVKITDHIFKPDGSFHMIERDLITNEQIDSEAKNRIDITANWENYPEFGKYDSLIRKEREITKV
jgi:hypothetical protein